MAAGRLMQPGQARQVNVVRQLQAKSNRTEDVSPSNGTIKQEALLLARSNQLSARKNSAHRVAAGGLVRRAQAGEAE